MTEATFEGLDLNLESDRTRYYDRCREEFMGVSDEEVFAAAAEVCPYFRKSDRWSAIHDISVKRIEKVRAVEQPLRKFRKVRAGWHTTAIVDWRDALEHNVRRDKGTDNKVLYEEYVDVSREEHGDMWVVSTRGGRENRDRVSQLNQHSLFNSRFTSFSDAKRYATALYHYLSNTGPHPDYLQHVFSEEHRLAHETKIESITGEKFADWEARIMARK